MLELGGVDPIRGRKEGKLDEGELPPIPDTGVTPDIRMLMRQCHRHIYTYIYVD